MGDAVNRAARFQTAADPGTVLISDDTRRLAAPFFEFEDRGMVAVKGKAEPGPAPPRVGGPAGARRGGAGARYRRSQLVARRALRGNAHAALLFYRAAPGTRPDCIGDGRSRPGQISPGRRVSRLADAHCRGQGEASLAGRPLVLLRDLDAVRALDRK